MLALPHRKVPAAVAAVRASGAAVVVKLAFELLVLTAGRWGEVRGAHWTEMDFAGRTWTIPAARMKAKRAHRIPLSGRAMEILEAAHTLATVPSPLVFPAADGGPLPDKVLRRLLQDRRIPAVPHGFRSTFRDWAAEETEHPREVIEAALAHVVTNQVEAAYAGRTCSSGDGGSWRTGPWRLASRQRLPESIPIPNGRNGRHLCWRLDLDARPRGSVRSNRVH